MVQITSNCSRCGAPMNPPKSGHYNCEFCGAPYFAGGIFSRIIHSLKRVSQTKGFNSSIIIPVGFGSVLFTLLIFRYPSFQKNKVEIIPTPTKKENTFEEDRIKKTIKISPKLINEEISKKESVDIPNNLKSTPLVPKEEISIVPKKTNKSDSDEFKTVYRRETNTFSYRMKIAGTIGFRPSIKTVNFVSRRNSSKNIKLNDKSNFYFNRGLEKKTIGNYEGALADYSKAIAINPNDSDFYYFRGWLKTTFEALDLVGAISDLNKLNELEPNNVQNLLDLASVYSRAQYHSKAFEILDIAQKIEPENGNIVWWRGIFTIKSGKLPAGCKFVREARRMKATDYNPTMLKSCN